MLWRALEDSWTALESSEELWSNHEIRSIQVSCNFKNMLPARVGSEFVPCNFCFYYRTAVGMEVLNSDAAVAARAISSFSAKLDAIFLTEDG